MSIFKLFHLTDTMLKIGCIGFGGGSALIPVMEEELVEKKSYISEEDFSGSMMIASITPGALPVEIATGIGYNVLCSSNMEWISMRYQILIKGCMLLMAVSGVIQTIKESPYRKKIDFFSGLLINVMFSLYFAIYEMPMVSGDFASLVPGIWLGILILNLWMYHIKSIHFFHKVLLSAGVSWIVFQLI